MHEAASSGLGNQPEARLGGPITLEEHSGAYLLLGAVEETASLERNRNYQPLSQIYFSVQGEL